MSSDSILGSVKRICGIHPEVSDFNDELVPLINGVLADVQQLGGFSSSVTVEDDSQLWTELTTVGDIELIKRFVFLSVKFLFDPPSTGFQTAAMQKQIDKAEWRLNLAREVLTPDPHAVTEEPA